MNKNFKKNIYFFLFLSFLFFSIFSNDKLNEKKSWAIISKDSSDSVVQLITFMAIYNWQEPYKSPEQRSSAGTAFFIDEKGHLITNAHCVNQGVVFYLQIPSFGKKRFEAKLLAICPNRDLALLKLTDESFNEIIKDVGSLKYLNFGDSDKVLRAEEILTLGYPLGQEWLKSTTGAVSGIQTLMGKQYIQIAAAINPGNSGGPALNEKGEVVGVNSSGIFKDGTQNVGYIIPANEVRVFLKEADNFINNFKNNENTYLMHVPIAGIMYHGSPETLIKYLNNPMPGGVFIAQVLENSLAYKIGLRDNDMIYEINNYKIDRFGELSLPMIDDKVSLASFINLLNIGDDINLVVYRNGEKLEFSGKWENYTNLPIRFFYPGYEEIDYLIIGGLVLMNLTINHIQLFAKQNDSILKYLEMNNQGKSALIISHVLPNSVAEQSRYIYDGMIIKEVNGKAVSNLNDFKESILENIESGYMTIRMESGEFFVASLKDILRDEKRLSKKYFYEIDNFIYDIEKKIKNKK